MLRSTIVYIALPHDLLAPTTEQALAAGRHVLVEKPMALDDEEARRLGRIAEARKLRLGVFFQQRRAGTVSVARRLVSGGAIGEVRMARIATVTDKPPAYYRSGWSGRVVDSWRTRRDQAGGGVVLMNSIHQLDAFRYITGLSFVGVLAATATLSSDIEVEDAASATLRLSNGGLANLAANAHSPGAATRNGSKSTAATGASICPNSSSGEPVRLFLRRPWRGSPRRTVDRHSRHARRQIHRDGAVIRGGRAKRRRAAGNRSRRRGGGGDGAGDIRVGANRAGSSCRASRPTLRRRRLGGFDLNRRTSLAAENFLACMVRVAHRPLPTPRDETYCKGGLPAAHGLGR